ncbi:Crp/Fnr family transcriptional regulator [Panacibacter ginsenosidivorans]|uniref:Crp/Fnr family transcriptional regulator n=1 Tax=Panacibacter ginsenosidivorans TaxID=1813871 RepID=A0A5B8V6N8_9BACT|nr:Crp/Fnr family transcriptional regulator [Panacibacter ginsenosidivorans]QEC66785.1 Crp/Fnr family transcriptional regulator [Panacibacter ginsenosidivorans]
MINSNEIFKTLPGLDESLVTEIQHASVLKHIPKDTEILREGQYVKVIPVVLKGLIKVYTQHKDKELLLYYIRPEESCIMSFAACLKNEPSKVFAITEDDTDALLLPVNKITGWIKQYPSINTLFFRMYNLRYSELLDTIHHLLFTKLDDRLYHFLKERSKLTCTNPLKISHKQIATELGTAREVITRVMKRLEQEGKVKQHGNSIEIC